MRKHRRVRVVQMPEIVLGGKASPALGQQIENFAFHRRRILAARQDIVLVKDVAEEMPVI